jgi:hypothetical protein
VASRNAMTLLKVASSGPRNGCYGEARQLADLRVYLPPVQQVSPPLTAWPAAGSAVALTLLAGQSRPMSAAPDRARIGERKLARSGAPLRAWRSPAHGGAGGHWRRASCVRGERSGAGTMKAGSPASAEGATSARA